MSDTLVTSDFHFPIEVNSVTLDLDGTLLDTVPDLAVAANAMLTELGLPTRSHDELRTYVGAGIPNFVARCLGQANLSKADATENHATTALQASAETLFKKHYALSNGQHSTRYPGVIEGLNALRQRGIKMACVTNKAAAFSEPLLRATGLMPYFEFVISGDTFAEKKPHPRPLLEACERLGTRPATNLHIGDSKHDAAAARAAGCPSVTVPYGYNEGEDVRKMPTDVIVPSVEAALALIKTP